MSELVLDFQYLLDKGMAPVAVACELEIPISWVYEAMDMNEDTESLSPFATINS